MEELEKNKDRVMTGKVRGRGYISSSPSPQPGAPPTQPASCPSFRLSLAQT